MRFVLYTHSLVSDWNHGNAHFLRGVLRELAARGHETLALEPEDGWSRKNLIQDRGQAAVNRFARDFPELRVRTYGAGFAHDAAIADADVVIVHEWTDPELVARLGRYRRSGAFTLLFHDTHHRAVSDADAIGSLPLEDYDAVLAFGEALQERYRQSGWGNRVFTWHEAADLRLFRPPEVRRPERDLVWIGNWGDGERATELREFLIEPAQRLALTGTIRGVRYPADALESLAATRLAYGGSIANVEVPRAFARHRLTVHVPRRPYVAALPGIPTIRMFEALACGIPLVSAPWEDCEGLFQAGRDFLMARTGAEMARHLRDLLHDPATAAEFAANGLATVRSRHGCDRRVDELLSILVQCGTACVRQAAARRELAS